jgi:autotransporter passenger strand-loop-strand repeat protein
MTLIEAACAAEQLSAPQPQTGSGAGVCHRLLVLSSTTKSLSATILTGGIETVLAGGTATATKIAGGAVTVAATGTASGAIVSAHGTLTVSSSGKSIATVISADGLKSVLKGGTASATRIAGGTLTVSSGAHISGTETFAGTGGKLSIAGTTGIAPSISGFAKGDTLDFASFGFKKTETLKFTEAASHKSGTLTITDGALKATVTLFGQYVAGGFKLASDGAGTAVTYVSATAAHHDVLAKGE